MRSFSLFTGAHSPRIPTFLLKPRASNSTTSGAAAPSSVAPRRGARSSPSSSSLYARPSLAEIQRERAVRRAEVFSFLRGLGIDPGEELAGLELPATAAVMRERVDFLHSLGLTVADINAYPLVLGCSVRKNMVPVLDFLGKLGVRRAALPDFLRRYPQVLHASVVVDLAPVVNYLQGMDIAPRDVPRVLERYPELLGFKLEGTMSTSVAYLVAIGVNRRELGGVLTRHPEILGMRVGKIIKPFVEHLEGIGLPRLAVARLIEKKPHILSFSLADQVKPSLADLLAFGVRKEALPSIIAEYPEILAIEQMTDKLAAQQSLFESAILVNRSEFGKVVERMPQSVSLTRSTVLRHVEFLKGCGFPLSQVGTMVVKCPQLLALNLDVMRASFEFFRDDMERDLSELAEFPAFFTYGLDSVVRPRHQAVVKKAIKCSLAWMLNCSDTKFEQRMQYDTVSIDEMEERDEHYSGELGILSKPKEDDDDDDDDDNYDEDEDDTDMEDNEDKYFTAFLDQ